MKVVIAGGTGFVGQRLTAWLTSVGHQVYILTRSPEAYTNTKDITYVGWLKEAHHPEASIQNCDAFINLAGESLFGYWTKAKKERILDSRILATQKVLELIHSMQKKPKVFVNASAIGFYGTSMTKLFSEDTTTPGEDFLATVTTKWENTARAAEDMGIRVVYARLGIILGQGGTLPLMALPYKFFVGGRIGSGEQWMSWIHIDDVVRILDMTLRNEAIIGPINLTAPNPIRNKNFSSELAKVLHRPDILNIPAFAIKCMLGEMSMLITKGQAVLPTKAQANHYHFQYTELRPALESLYKKRK